MRIKINPPRMHFSNAVPVVQSSGCQKSNAQVVGDQRRLRGRFECSALWHKSSNNCENTRTFIVKAAFVTLGLKRVSVTPVSTTHSHTTTTQINHHQPRMQRNFFSSPCSTEALLSPVTHIFIDGGWMLPGGQYPTRCVSPVLLLLCWPIYRLIPLFCLQVDSFTEISLSPICIVRRGGHHSDLCWVSLSCLVHSVAVIQWIYNYTTFAFPNRQ